jgi:hypothetical protein
MLHLLVLLVSAHMNYIIIINMVILVSEIHTIKIWVLEDMVIHMAMERPVDSLEVMAPVPSSDIINTSSEKKRYLYYNIFFYFEALSKIL